MAYFEEHDVLFLDSASECARRSRRSSPPIRDSSAALRTLRIPCPSPALRPHCGFVAVEIASRRRRAERRRAGAGQGRGREGGVLCLNAQGPPGTAVPFQALPGCERTARATKTRALEPLATSTPHCCRRCCCASAGSCFMPMQAPQSYTCASSISSQARTPTLPSTTTTTTPPRAHFAAAFAAAGRGWQAAVDEF